MTCKHRWKIDSLSRDDVFHAVCRHCGATRDFPRELDIDKPSLQAQQQAFAQRFAARRNHRGKVNA